MSNCFDRENKIFYVFSETSLTAEGKEAKKLILRSSNKLRVFEVLQCSMMEDLVLTRLTTRLIRPAQDNRQTYPKIILS